MKIRRMTMIAMSVAILFVQEQMLMILPNISFSVLLIILYASVFELKENIILITAYVILDNMFLGGFNLFYMIPMLLAWYIIPVSYHTFLRKTKNEVTLARFALVFGFVYGWIFIPFSLIQMGMNNFIPYLTADILFEITMAISGFLTVYWLFKPLYNGINGLVNNQYRYTIKAYK